MSLVNDFWSTPLTRSGRSALVPRGPWQYAMTGLGAYYRADFDVLKELVPKPLELVSDEVFTYLTEIISWSPNAVDLALDVPDLVQYSEGAFFLKVRLKGLNYVYCPFMWVDNDLSFLRGLLAGWPKKLAKISITRLHPLLEHLNEPRKGIRLGGYISRAGSTLYRLKVELTSNSPTNSLPLISEHSFLLPRYFPGVAPELTTVNELVVFDGESTTKAWEGDATLDIIGSPNDELYFFKPVSRVKGYYFYLLLRIKGLKRVGSIEGF